MKLKTDQYMWLRSIKEYKNNCLYWGYLTIIGIIFYIMNCYTPRFSDDWHYCYIFGTTTHITSITDILKSQYYHYFEFNGRFTPHFFVQLFAGILGKSLFNIINSIIFILFFHLIIITTQIQRPNIYNKFPLSCIAIFLVFILMPDFGLCFLWMSGACNYLWSGTILLSFNYLLQKTDFKKRTYPILLIFGLLSGWTHEGLVVGLTCGYTIYFVLNPKHFTLPRKILMIGFYIGATLLIFSPGSISRALGTVSENAQFFELLKSYFSAIISLSNIRLFPLFCFILLTINKYADLSYKIFIKNNIVWLCAILILFQFIIATRFTQGSSRFGIELFSLVLLLKLLNNIMLNKHLYVTLGINIILLFVSSYAAYLCHDNYTNFKFQQEQIKAGKSLILTNSKQHPSIIWPRFLINDVPNEYNGDIYINKSRYNNRTYCPKAIYDEIKKDPNSYKSFKTINDLPFYVKDISDIEDVINVTFILNPTDFQALPFYIKPIAHKLQRYTINSLETHYYNIIKIENKKYIIIAKNKAIDKRLNHIKII